MHYNIIAQAAPTNAGATIDTVLTAINLGLAGVGLLAFVKGWIVPGKTYDESIQREKEARDALAELNQTVNEKFLPEIQRSRAVQIALGQLVDRVVSFVEREEQNESRKS
jgi:hypothetical protein